LCCVRFEEKRREKMIPFGFVLDLRNKSWYLLDLSFGKKKNLENLDRDPRKKRKDDEKWKKLDVDGSLLSTMDMQSNG